MRGKVNSVSGDNMKFIENMVDEVYDPSKTYNKGDTVLYNKVLYICKNDGTTGKWNADLWEQTTLVSILNSNLTTINNNVSAKAQKWFSGYVGKSFSIPAQTSEIIIYVFVNGSSEICLTAHWCHLMVDWFNGVTRGIRLLGKSATNGIEYGAVLSYDDNKIIQLQQAWQGTSDVTASTIVCFAYR